MTVVVCSAFAVTLSTHVGGKLSTRECSLKISPDNTFAMTIEDDDIRVGDILEWECGGELIEREVLKVVPVVMGGVTVYKTLLLRSVLRQLLLSSCVASL